MDYEILVPQLCIFNNKNKSMLFTKMKRYCVNVRETHSNYQKQELTNVGVHTRPSTGMEYDYLSKAQKRNKYIKRVYVKIVLLPE